jgi:hypothetical protein
MKRDYNILFKIRRTYELRVFKEYQMPLVVVV